MGSVPAPRDRDLLARVRAVRARLQADGPERLRRPDDFARVALAAADADVLRDLLVAEDAHVVIEIGLAYGASALAIGEALVTTGRDRGTHVVVDAFQEHFHDAGWDAILRAGLDSLCVLLRERSQLALPRLVSQGFVADAAFVDGSHVFHNVFVDLVHLRDLVRAGGLVVLDDCDTPAVATAVRYFELNVGWLPEPLQRETCLRAYRLPDPPVEPGLEDFRPFALPPPV